MQKNYHKIFLATLFVAISCILYGFLGLLGTSILQENIPISTMLFWRFLIAGSWIFLFVIKKYMIQRVFCTIDKTTLFFTFFLGAIGYAGSSGFYFIASKYTGTGLAMVIFFSFPIIVTLASWLKNRENISTLTLFSLISMVAGLFLLRDSSTHQFNTIGVFFGIIAAICYAFYVLGSKRISSTTVDSDILTTIVCLGCAFIFLILSISSDSYVFPHSIKSWLYFLALGILTTALPIQLMLEGLKYISSVRASIISVLEPLVTVLVGVIFLNESISHLQTVGISIILVSAILVQFQREV